MLVLLQLIETEATEPSKAPFYIVAAVLVVFALLLSAVGTVRHETFPPSRSSQRVIMLVCALLVAGTMLTAVITA